MGLFGNQTRGRVARATLAQQTDPQPDELSIGCARRSRPFIMLPVKPKRPPQSWTGSLTSSPSTQMRSSV